MGRFADLCAAIAEAAEEGPDGLILMPDTWDALRGEDWDDGDIEDALGIVHETLLQGELIDSADSLCARLMEVLAPLGDADAFSQAETEGAAVPLDDVAQVARRVVRLEEVLDAFRSAPSPDRRGFDALYTRLMNRGIEDEMEPQIFERAARGDEDEDDV